MGNTVTLETCWWPASSQSIRIVNIDGKVVTYSGEIVRVCDVLQPYPHHYLIEASQESKPSKAPMLHHEEVLNPGSTYVLHPLPLLFNVRDRRRTPRPSYASYCCACIATGRFTVLESSDESCDGRHREQRAFRSSPLMTGMERTGTDHVMESPQNTARSPSAVPVDLHELLKRAEIEWKEIVDKSWRPDLESIKEEPIKSPLIQSPMIPSPLQFAPRRQTLASLVSADVRGERG